MNIAFELIQAMLNELRQQGHKPTERIVNSVLDTVPNVHHCTTFREGDWMVLRCPLCEGFERRFNFRTGEMRCSGGMFFGIIHTGISTGKSNMEALTHNQHPN